MMNLTKFPMLSLLLLALIFGVQCNKGKSNNSRSVPSSVNDGDQLGENEEECVPSDTETCEEEETLPTCTSPQVLNTTTNICETPAPVITAASCAAESKAYDDITKACVACDPLQNVANGKCENTEAFCESQEGRTLVSDKTCKYTAAACQDLGKAFDLALKTCKTCEASQEVSNGNCVNTAAYCTSISKVLDATTGECTVTAAYCLTQNGKDFDEVNKVCKESVASCTAVAKELVQGVCKITEASCAASSMSFQPSLDSPGSGTCIYNAEYCQRLNLQFNPTLAVCIKDLAYCSRVEHKSYIDSAGNCTDTAPTPSVADCQRNGKYYYSVSNLCEEPSEVVCASLNSRFEPATATTLAKCSAPVTSQKDICELDPTKTWVAETNPALSDCLTATQIEDKNSCHVSYLTLWNKATHTCDSRATATISNIGLSETYFGTVDVLFTSEYAITYKVPIKVGKNSKIPSGLRIKLLGNPPTHFIIAPTVCLNVVTTPVTDTVYLASAQLDILSSSSSTYGQTVVSFFGDGLSAQTIGSTASPGAGCPTATTP